jgi:hypothetical protein
MFDLFPVQTLQTILQHFVPVFFSSLFVFLVMICACPTICLLVHPLSSSSRFQTGSRIISPFSHAKACLFIGPWQTGLKESETLQKNRKQSKTSKTEGSMNPITYHFLSTSTYRTPNSHPDGGLDDDEEEEWEKEAGHRAVWA